MRLSRMSWFVSGEQINYLPKPKAEANNWSARLYFATTEFNNCFFIRSQSIFGKRSNLPFSLKSDRNKEKSVVSFTHEQNIICSQTKLGDIAHEQTIICRHLFAGHVVSSRPMKRKKNLQRMIIWFLHVSLLQKVVQPHVILRFWHVHWECVCKSHALQTGLRAQTIRVYQKHVHVSLENISSTMEGPRVFRTNDSPWKCKWPL